ncbi:MAG: methyl-accepting chemotaxis protein, partial [Myxococcota bacterium]
MNGSLMPLRTRLTLLVSGLLVAIAICLVIIFPAQMRAISEASAKKKAIALVQLIARSARVAVEFNDDQVAARTLGQLEADDEVLYAEIALPDGQRLATYVRADQSGRDFAPESVGLRHSSAPDVLIRDSVLHAAINISVTATTDPFASDSDAPEAAAIAQPAQRAATLYLGLSLDPIERAAARYLQITLWLCFAILVVGLVVTLVVANTITKRLGAASQRIAQVSNDIYAATQQQEAAGTEHSTSVQEVTQTMQSLNESAKHIADSAQEVLENAEKARQTTDETAAKISELSTHANRISEILETIRDIADRSDLLALNASLEATRAGEAGRAFSLVAAEMRRLAETVTDSVQVVKGLVSDVRGSGAESVVAIEDNRKLVESTTESSRQIGLVTHQQQAVTEQVSQSMRDIARVIRQSVSATQQTRTSAEILTKEAEMLAA